MVFIPGSNIKYNYNILIHNIAQIHEPVEKCLWDQFSIYSIHFIHTM